MAKPMVDIEQVRPNMWVVLDQQDQEGGTIVRRFERWTCTCAEADCRHVTAARSLIAKAATAVKAVAPKHDDESEHVERQRPPATADPADPADQGDDTVTFTLLPPARQPRKVRVSDRAALRVAGKEVAA